MKLVVGLKRLEYAYRLNEFGLTTLEKRRIGVISAKLSKSSQEEKK